jgi:hypothetical protein
LLDTGILEPRRLLLKSSFDGGMNSGILIGRWVPALLPDNYCSTSVVLVGISESVSMLSFRLCFVVGRLKGALPVRS